jgi:hypothetical protein
MLDSGMPGSAWCMFVATRYRHRNFPSTNILGCYGLLYGPRLPGFGVLHSVLRDETTVFHTQSASEQAQLVNMAIVVR